MNSAKATQDKERPRRSNEFALTILEVGRRTKILDGAGTKIFVEIAPGKGKR